MERHRILLLCVALGGLVASGCRREEAALGDAPGASAGGAAVAEQEQRLNVLMIVVDTLRRDHLSCYGYERETSPNIDRLAAGGTRYDRASSQAPWTTASIGSLMTSRYPSELGIKSDRSVLHDDHLLLAEMLRAAGYRTAAAISHNFCSSKWNFDQGFESFDESNVLGHQELSSPGVTARGIELLEELQSEPFFLWLHYFDPHFAYNEHTEHAFGDPETYGERVTAGMPFSKLTKLRKTLSQEELQQIRDYYDSEIRYTDRYIGQVLDKLAELELDENTLVVLTADHGEEFLDHDRLGHAKTLYREVIGVPLIIRAPGRAPSVVDDPVGLVDVTPTILECLGLDATSVIRGTSLFAQSPDRPVFMENARGKPIRAVVHGRYKLVEQIGRNRFELYDLQQDPAEQNNLAHSEAERGAELKQLLKGWAKALAEAPVQAVETDLSDELQDHLKAMGYGNGDDEDE